MAEGGDKQIQTKREDMSADNGFVMVTKGDCTGHGDKGEESLDFQNDLTPPSNKNKTEEEVSRTLYHEGSLYPDKREEGSMAMETSILIEPWKEQGIKLVVQQPLTNEQFSTAVIELDVGVEPFLIQYLVHCKRNILHQLADNAGCKLSIKQHWLEFWIMKSNDLQDIATVKKKLIKDLKEIFEEGLILCYCVHVREEHDIQEKFLAQIKGDPPKQLTTKKCALLRKYDQPDVFVIVAEKNVMEETFKEHNNVLKKAKRDKEDPSFRKSFKVVQANAEKIKTLKLVDVLNAQYKGQIKCKLQDQTVICEGPSKLLEKCEEDLDGICQSVKEEKIEFKSPTKCLSTGAEQFIMEKMTKSGIECLVRVLSGHVVLFTWKDEMMKKGEEVVYQCLSTLTKQREEAAKGRSNDPKVISGHHDELSQSKHAAEETKRSSTSIDGAKTSSNLPDASATGGNKPVQQNMPNAANKDTISQQQTSSEMGKNFQSDRNEEQTTELNVGTPSKQEKTIEEFQGSRSEKPSMDGKSDQHIVDSTNTAQKIQTEEKQKHSQNQRQLKSVGILSTPVSFEEICPQESNTRGGMHEMQRREKKESEASKATFTQANGKTDTKRAIGADRGKTQYLETNIDETPWEGKNIGAHRLWSNQQIQKERDGSEGEEQDGKQRSRSRSDSTQGNESVADRDNLQTNSMANMQGGQNRRKPRSRSDSSQGNEPGADRDSLQSNNMAYVQGGQNRRKPRSKSDSTQGKEPSADRDSIQSNNMANVQGVENKRKQTSRTDAATSNDCNDDKHNLGADQGSISVNQSRVKVPDSKVESGDIPGKNQHMTYKDNGKPTCSSGNRQGQEVLLALSRADRNEKAPLLHGSDDQKTQLEEKIEEVNLPRGENGGTAASSSHSASGKREDAKESTKDENTEIFGKCKERNKNVYSSLKEKSELDQEHLEGEMKSENAECRKFLEEQSKSPLLIHGIHSPKESADGNIMDTASKATVLGTESQHEAMEKSGGNKKSARLKKYEEEASSVEDEKSMVDPTDQKNLITKGVPSYGSDLDQNSGSSPMVHSMKGSDECLDENVDSATINTTVSRTEMQDDSLSSKTSEQKSTSKGDVLNSSGDAGVSHDGKSPNLTQSSQVEKSYDLDFCRFKLLEMPLVRKQVEKRLNSVVKSGSYISWHTTKENDAKFVLNITCSSIHCCDNCRQIIKGMLVEAEFSRKEILNVKDDLGKLGKTCPMFVDGLEDDTTDLCNIVCLDTDSEKILQIMEQSKEDQENQVKDRPSSKDGVAARTRSKTKEELLQCNRLPTMGGAQAQAANKVSSELPIQADVLDFLISHEKDALTNIEKTYRVDIQITCNGILLEGHANQVTKALRELKNLSSRILTKEIKCDDVTHDAFLQDDVTTIIQRSKENCREPVEISCVGLDKTEPSYYCTWISNQCKLLLIVTYGRVENTKADAMLFPCGSDLNPVGTKSWDILRKGGQTSIMDSFSEIKEKKKYTGNLRQCEIHVSEQTGNLDLQNLIFARIPVWKNTKDVDSNGLENLCKNLLKLINEKGLRRVVIPVDISTEFVYEDFCQFLVYFLSNYASKELTHHQAEVHLCVSTKDKAETLREKCNASAGGKKRNVIAVLHYVPIDMIEEDDVPQSDRRIPCIKICEKSLVDMDSEVDVIVNSTNTQLDLSQGFVSNSLLKKAGKRIQDECSSGSPVGIGEVVSTGPGSMKCKQIYHGVLLPMWISSGNFSLHVIRCVMLKCLKEAEDRGHTSIAFPALGTGKLGYPWHNVAETMFDVIDEYCAAVQSSHIKTVYFVLQPNDEKTIRAFEFKERVREAKKQKKEEFKELDHSITFLETRIPDFGVIIQAIPESSMMLMSEKPDVHILFDGMSDEAGSEKSLHTFEENPLENCYYCRTKTGKGSKAFMKTLEETLKMINTRRFVSVAIHLKDIGDKSKIVEKIGELKEKVMMTLKEVYEGPSKSASSHPAQKYHGKIYSRRFFFVLRDDLFKRLEDKQAKGFIKLPWKHAVDWNVVTRSFGNCMSFIVMSKSPSAMDIACKHVRDAVDSFVSLREEEYTESWFEQKDKDNAGCLKVLKPKISRRLEWTKRNNWSSIEIKHSDGKVFHYDLQNSLIYHCQGDEKRQHACLIHKIGTKKKSAPDRPPPPFTGTKAKPATSPLPHGDQEKDKTLEEDNMQEEPSSPQDTNMEIFTSIEASVNTGIQLQGEDLKKKLSGIGKLKLSKKGDDVCLWSSSLTDIEGAENVLQNTRSSNDQQLNLKPNSGTDLEQNKPVQLITKLQCKEIEYKALGFFHKEDAWYQENANRIKWKDDEIYLDRASAEDNEKLKDKLKCISDMNMYDITLESHENDKYGTVLDGLTSNFPNAFMFEHDDKVGITALCDSYEAISKIKHKGDVLLGRIKVSQGRRRNRFGDNVKTSGEEPSEITSESHAQTRRNHQFMTSSSDSSKFSPTLRNSDSTVNSVEFHTAEGILVKVYSASITRLSVDCIVNAANENLMHGGGVAYAISNAAGYDFDRESQDYIKKHGPIPIGNCCTTGAGNLPYKCVIHTVGPRWSDYNDKRQCEKDLEQAVEVTFKEAVHQGCDSIAVPAISSGIFGVPKDVCVKQYYLAVVSYSQSALHPVKEIHFVDKDQRMVDCIIKNFKEYFSSDKSLKTSQGDQGISNQQGLGHSSISNQQGQNHKRFSYQQSQGHSSISNQQGQGHKGFSNQQGHGQSSVSNQQDLNQSTRSYSSVVQSNQSNQHRMSSGSSDEEMAIFEISSSITVRISVGDIIDVDAEAIVCPQDLKCQSKGGIAKAIHNVADKIYKPDEEGRLSNLRVADVVVLETVDTIKWRYIFHAIPPRWKYSSTSNSDSYNQFLGFTYRAILGEAKNYQMKSVAVPVLGFGDTGFKSVVEKNSEIFPEELSCFARNQRKKDRLDIHIVCKDKSVLTTLVKGFEKTFKRIPIGSMALEDSVQDDDLNKTMRPPSIMEPISMEKVEGTCVICMDDYTDPQKLKKCGHVFCKECIEQYFGGYKPSCPNCGVIYGKIMGNQPEGSMTIAKDRVRLPGYDSYTGIKVTYSFLDGKQGPDHQSPGTPYKGIVRSGYLPDNTEGRLVAKLLNVAFTRKLVFTIGRSRTTGHDGVLTWNDIHHKTRTHGGTERFGYPDPTYIERVMDELSVKGVTEESADDPSEYTEYSKVFH